MKTYTYYLAAITAFVMWGFFSLALKPLAAYASLDILFYRVFICVGLLCIINLVFRFQKMKATWLYLKDLPKKDQINVSLVTVGGSMLLMANWFIFIYVMNHISVQAAAFAYLVCPILTTVFAYFILKDRLSTWQWMAVALSTISCVMLAIGHVVEVFYSLLVAATYALYLILQKKNVHIDKFLLLSAQLLIAAIVMLPFFSSASGEVPQEGRFYIYLLIIALFFTIIPLFLNLYALGGINSSTVGILLYINPLINFLLAIFYYKEAVTIHQLLAYGVIAFSIVLFNYSSIKKTAKQA